MHMRMGVPWATQPKLAWDAEDGRDSDVEHLPYGPPRLCQGRPHASWGRPHPPPLCGDAYGSDYYRNDTVHLFPAGAGKTKTVGRPKRRARAVARYPKKSDCTVYIYLLYTYIHFAYEVT